MIRWLALTGALLVTLAACGPPPARPLPERAPDPPRAPFVPIEFPRDEAPHDKLTEWWYYTGHLFDADGTRYGFEFVIFQAVRGTLPVGYVAHMAVTDPARGRFWHSERSTIGSQIGRQDAIALDVAGWQLQGALGHDHIYATGEEYGLDLRLTASKPPVLHAGIGWFSYGPVGDSYYYSRTRLAVEGTLFIGTEARPVQGQAWMDHQWGDFLVLGGWDWFSIQLDDDTELMLTYTRLPDGRPGFAFGTQVATDGTAIDLAMDSVTVEPLGSWTSPHTGATYPSGWRVAVPSRQLVLELQPTMQDQELQSLSSTGIAYWEGQVEITGRRADAPIAGLGYVELVGYATARPSTATSTTPPYSAQQP
ncbi:MAG: hypothetical protein IRZ14_14125 [Chloroflexi bacterium]|nr:hypothetical protein [Chloroflexota bacterium]